MDSKWQGYEGDIQLCVLAGEVALPPASLCNISVQMKRSWLSDKTSKMAVQSSICLYIFDLHPLGLLP